MRKLFCLLGFSVLFTFAIDAKSFEVGQKFPIEKLTKETVRADNTIIAFVPSLTEDCEYASMLTQSFYYYFDQNLAFEKLPKNTGNKSISYC